jgi:hypothetical protein
MDTQKVKTPEEILAEGKAIAQQLNVKKLYRNSKDEWFTSENLAGLSDDKKNIVTYDFTIVAANASTTPTAASTATAETPSGNTGASKPADAASTDAKATAEVLSGTEASKAADTTATDAKATAEASTGNTEFEQLQSEHKQAIEDAKTPEEVADLLKGYESDPILSAAANAKLEALKQTK